MKAKLLMIIVGLIILSSVVFVAIWYGIPEECDKECEIQMRGIGAEKSGHGTFDSFEKHTEIKQDTSPIKEEHYSIEITGMKDIYRIGEQYDFSYVISGYGYSCGSKKITFPDEDGEIMTIHSSSSCMAEEPMREFVIDSKNEYDTTSVHGVIKIPGIYNVTVTFDRPSHDFPTTAIREFRVPPINSWHNNQLKDADLQTVMDSCANDSPKERMVNGLRYTNATHVFLNLGCEWQKIGKFVSEPKPLDIASIEDNHIHLNPADVCATISLKLLSEYELEQKKSGPREAVFLEFDENDTKEIPVLDELIRATHHLEFPANDFAHVEMGMRDLVDYEFFIMAKSIEKYGNTKADYFMKLDEDLDERLADPKKQGFSNEFIAPQIVYHDKTYVLGHTVFWVSDEHEMQSLSVHLRDELEEEQRFVVLNDNDMDSIPKIRDAITKIGTELEGIVAFKGIPDESEWNQYREWYATKSSEQFDVGNDDDDAYVHGFVYNNEYYDLGFLIC